MPKHRQDRTTWLSITRPRIWLRDHGQCFHCLQLGTAHVLPLEACHIDHIQSGKRGTNADSNLRTLCRRCHVLRNDMRHRGMIGGALKIGLIPPDYRPLLW
jgi:5-methylcytosine-specific restriction protein A